MDKGESAGQGGVWADRIAHPPVDRRMLKGRWRTVRTPFAMESSVPAGRGLPMHAKRLLCFHGLPPSCVLPDRVERATLTLLVRLCFRRVSAPTLTVQSGKLTRITAAVTKRQGPPSRATSCATVVSRTRPKVTKASTYLRQPVAHAIPGNFNYET